MPNHVTNVVYITAPSQEVIDKAFEAVKMPDISIEQFTEKKLEDEQ